MITPEDKSSPRLVLAKIKALPKNIIKNVIPKKAIGIKRYSGGIKKKNISQDKTRKIVTTTAGRKFFFRVTRSLISMIQSGYHAL